MARTAIPAALLVAALAAACGAAPRADEPPVTAAADDPAVTWCEAFAEQRDVDVPDAATVAAIFADVLDRSVGAATALVAAATRDGALPSAAADAVSRGLDVYLYRLAYRGDWHEHTQLLAGFGAVLGSNSVLEKHRVLAALSGARPGATDALVALTGGRADSMDALALEFSTRGAHEAAASAWEFAASRTDRRRASAWLRHAADSFYADGRLSDARRVLDASIGAADDVEDAWTAAYDVASRRGDPRYTPAGVVDAAGVPCTANAARRVGTAELILARRAIAAGEVAAAANRLRERLDADCATDVIAPAAGMLLVDAHRSDLAIPFLRSAVVFRPTDIALVTVLLSVVDGDRDGDAVADVLAASVEPLIAEPEPVSPHVALTLGEVLTSAGARTGLAALDASAAALLDAVGEAHPGDFQLAVARVRLAGSPVAVEVFERFVEASDEPITARLAAGWWMERNADDPAAAALWYERAAAEPGADRTYGTLGTGRSGAFVAGRERSGGDVRASAFAWLRAAVMAAEAGQPDRAAGDVDAFLHAADHDVRWSLLWQSGVVDALRPDVRLRVARRSIDDGHAGRDVYLVLGAAALATGDEDASIAAYATAVTLEPDRAADVVDILSRAGVGDVLAAALEHAADEADVAAVHTALAMAHARLAVLAPDSSSESVHRALARGAMNRALARGADWAAVDHDLLVDAGLHDLAAARSEASVTQFPDDLDHVADLVVDLANAGAPTSRIEAVVAPVLTALPSRRLGGMRAVLGSRGYPQLAARVGEQELRVYDRSSEAFGASAVQVVELAIAAGDRDAVRRLVHEHFVSPARALDSAIVPVPERYRRTADREAVAGRLLRDASGLYFEAGMWSAAADTALDALEHGNMNAGVLLPRALRAQLFATGGALSGENVERLVARAGGDVAAWRLAAFTLQNAQRWTLAQNTWERVLALADDDWAARAQLGAVYAALDQPTRAYDEMARACADAAATDGDDAAAGIALMGARSLQAAARPDLAERLLAAQPDRPDVVAERVQLLVDAGHLDRAARVLASAALPPARRVVLLFAIGDDDGAARLWIERAASMSPIESAEVLSNHMDALLARTTADEFEHAVLAGLGGGSSSMIGAQTVASAHAARGRLLRAAFLLRPYAAEMAPYELVQLAELFSAAGAHSAADETLTIVRQSPYGTTESDDRAVPALELVGMLVRRDQADDVLEVVRRLAVAHPDPMWTRIATAELELVLGRWSDALDAADSVRASLERDPEAVSTSDGRDRRATVLALELAAAGFGAEAADLAAAIADATESPVAARGAIAIAVRNGLPDHVAEAVDRHRRLTLGEPSTAGSGCLALAFSSDPSAGLACFEELVGAGDQRARLDAAAAAWLGSIAADDRRFADTAARMLDEDGPTTVPELAWWAAAAAYDMPAAGQFAVGAPGAIADVVTTEFYGRYHQGDVRGAVDQLFDAVGTTEQPGALIRRALDGVHPLVDPDAARDLAMAAVRTMPGDLHTRVTAYVLGADDASWLVQRGCAGGASAVLAGFDLPQDADAYLAVAERIDACGRLPTPEAARYASALVAVGRIEDAAAWAVRAGDSPRGELEQAVRDALSVGAFEEALTLLGNRDAEGSWPALRARARAGLGDIPGATADAERWLAAPSRLDRDGPDLLAALAGAGAFGAADRVATALYSVPSMDGLGPVGPSLVADGYARGDAAVGVRWLAEHHPDAFEHPVLAGFVVGQATLLERAGRVDDALALYERALAFDPENGVLANNLAYLLAVHDRELERAERLARRALVQIGQPDPGTLDTLAWVLHRRGRHAEAEAAITTALRLAPYFVGFDPSDEENDVLLAHLEEIRAAADAAPPRLDPAPQQRRVRRRR